MDEAQFVQERTNNRMVMEAELIRQAVAGMIVKGSRNQFSKLVKKLSVETNPFAFLFGKGSSELTEAQKDGPTEKKTLGTVKLPPGVRGSEASRG
jgi:hypothetical protein